MVIFGFTYLIATVLQVFGMPSYYILYGIAILLVAILFGYKNIALNLVISAFFASFVLFSVHNYFNNELIFKDQTLDFVAIALEDEVRFDEYSSVIVNIKTQEETFKSKIYISNYLEEISVSDKIYGTGYFYQPKDSNGFAKTSYYKGKNIDLIVSVNDFYVVYNEKTTFLSFFNDIRLQIIENIDFLFSERTSQILCGLLLGDKSNFTSEDSSNFSKVGITHILAVSGLHIGFLFALCLKMFGKGIGFRISCVVIILFILIVGFSPSIIRACIMQLILIFCWERAEEYSSIRALLIALVLMLAYNPYVIYDIGFVLSFLSAFALIAVHPLLYNAFKTGNKIVNKYIIMPSMVFLSVFLVTFLPLFYYFEKVTTLSMLSNILILSIVTILFPIAILVVVLSLISLKFASYFVFLVEIMMTLMLFFVDLVSKFKLATVRFDIFYTLIILSLAVILTISLIVKFRTKTTVLLTLICVLSTNLYFSHMQSNQFVMKVFSVGDGQCILIKNIDDIILIDCGSTNYLDAGLVVNEYMYDIGEDTIDYLILTSIDKSHVNGINSLNVNVLNIYYPELIANKDYYDDLEMFLTERNLQKSCEIPNYVNVYDDVDKKLAVQIDDILFLHSFTNNMIDEIMEKQDLSCETLIIADKVIEKYKELYVQIEKLSAQNAILSNDYEQLYSVSGIPCKSTIKLGDILVIKEGING